MKQTRRDFVAASAALLSVPLLSGAGQPAPRRRIDFRGEEAQDLDRISAWLNGLTTLTAAFVQTSPEGKTAQGTFYLARPGRLRFEYRAPSPLLIVATGGNIYVRNSRLNTVDRTSVSDTPLRLLLADDIDLKRNPAVLAINRVPGALVLHARSSTNRMSENMVITFDAAPDIRIREWVVKDIQGDPTSVALSQVQTGMALPDALFAVPVKAPSARKGAG
jgi:outer membrane lipoprotein-sorting protein